MNEFDNRFDGDGQAVLTVPFNHKACLVEVGEVSTVS